MIDRITGTLIGRAERRLGAGLDYVRRIAETNLGLLVRYNRIFGFLDPNRHTSTLAYHAVRIRGALAADCGTCVQIEINLASNADVDEAAIDSLLAGRYDELPDDVAAAARLADTVVGQRGDLPDAREAVRVAWGEAGLIELVFAMNGAALLPGIKRGMGYATACDLDVLRRTART